MKSSYVVLETRVLISRHLEDKNDSLGLGLGLDLEEKVLQFFKTFVAILDRSEQGTPWHFVRDNKSCLPFGSHCLRKPSALNAHQPQLTGYSSSGSSQNPAESSTHNASIPDELWAQRDQLAEPALEDIK